MTTLTKEFLLSANIEAETPITIIHSGKWNTRYARCRDCSEEMLTVEEWQDGKGWVKIPSRCYRCRPLCESDPDAPMQAVLEWLNEVPEDEEE